MILAAGFSRRLGRPKQEILLAGEPLLVRAARTAVEAGLSPVIAVMQDDSWQNRLADLAVEVVANPDAAEGMASSLRTGIGTLARMEPEIEGVVILTCDQPLLQAGHLRALFADPDRVTASLYGGRKAVPAYFPRSSFAALLAIQGDVGARTQLASADAVPNEELALDIDTEEQLREAQERLVGAASSRH